METSGLYWGTPKRYAFVWYPAFFQRQMSVYPQENVPEVQKPFSPSTDSWPAGNPVPVSNEDIEERFVNINRWQHYVDRSWSKRLLLGHFLLAADIEILRGPPLQSLSKKLALLDDRNSSSVTRQQQIGTCRPCRGPLNVQELFAELSQDRLPEPSNAAGPVPAERRLIYITDVDPYYALALAATSSRSQAVFLRGFIDQYLKFEPVIDVGMFSPHPTARFATFAMEFHLPYYSWVEMKSMIKDHRKKTNGQPLRRSEEVMCIPLQGYVSQAAQPIRGYIYQSQISVMVSGIDNWVWTAYCFVDVYFKGSEHTEQPEYYCNEAREKRTDPHSCGKYLADMTVWDPRKYFLRALSARMEQVREEWARSVECLLEQTTPYVDSFPRNPKPMKNADLKFTAEEAFDWSNKTLSKFSNLLTKIIIAWDKFENREIQYFYDAQTGELADSSWISYISTIRKDVDHLRNLLGSLKDQKELFGPMTTNRLMQAQFAETCIASEQSRSTQALSYINISFLPLSLAATLYSSVETKYFVSLVFLFVVVTIVLVAIRFHVDKFFRSLQNKPRWFWASLLRLLEHSGLKMRAKKEVSEDEDEDEDGIGLEEMTGGKLHRRTGRGAGGEV